MKIRKAFVANSSSSSFICDTCGENFSGWDASPRDFEHYQCGYAGHIFCEEELVDAEEFNRKCEENEDTPYEVPSEHCPCCTFKFITDYDMQLFLKKRYGVEESEVFAIVKESNKRRKKLYPQEYVTYVVQKLGTTVDEQSKFMRTELKNYDGLMEYIK